MAARGATQPLVVEDPLVEMLTIQTVALVAVVLVKMAAT
jgi:hypothetical protein